MADQTVKKYLSIGTTFDPRYLSLDSTFKGHSIRMVRKWYDWVGMNWYCHRILVYILYSFLKFLSRILK